IGLTGHATGDQRQQEGQHHRDDALPDRHVEARVPEPGNATSDTTWPAANQLIGASMWPGSLTAAVRRENICPRSWNARSAVRQLNAKLISPEATMQEAPNQSVHCTMLAKPAPSMTPFACRIGTSTPQHNVPETRTVKQTRMPMKAPAATNMKS